MEEVVGWCVAGVTDLFRIQCTLNLHGYNSILQRYAIPSGLRLVGLSFVFNRTMTQHTSRLCKGYLTKESDGVLHQMTWSPQSTDLNPIEVVWDELDHRGKEKQPTSAQHLWELFKTVRKSFLVKLVERMPRLCKAVIKAKGGYFEESKIYFNLFDTLVTR
uniref:Tc1-like transposase DDE domain-containing protein n=1 Tax=Oncorhynchus tshawytscha TaxID=74940 RepID=A0AAZ3S0L9_ONCTS